MSWIAAKFLAQLRVLRRHAHRAGIQVADPHHNATQSYQGGSGKAEFFGPQQSGNDHVAAGLELAVSFHYDAAAQVVEHQSLVRIGQAQFPGQASVFDTGLRRRPGAAVVAADEDHIGVPLGHPGSDGAHAHLGDQFDIDAGMVIGVLQIVDQLGQILNGVDIVMRRRRYQPYAGRRIAHLGDPGIDLASRQFAALARLGALGHLDLQFARVDQVIAGDPEASGGHLLDGTVARISVGIGDVARRVLTAFAGIAAPTDPVHGYGQILVGFLADRTVGHGPALEAPGYGLHRLDLIQGDGRVGEFELQLAAQSGHLCGLIIDQIGVLFVELELIGARSLLQLVHRLGTEEVGFAILAPLVLPAGIQGAAITWIFGEGALVLPQRFPGDLVQANALDARIGPGEILVDNALIEPHGLKNLGAAIGLDGGDTHLGHHLDHALDHGFVVAGYGLFVGQLRQHAFANHVIEAFVDHVGIDGLDPVAQQQAKMMNLARFAGFEHQPHPGAAAGTDQMVVQARHRQQRRNGRARPIHFPV